ncbi:hypothetical protein [Acaryochloris sp. CCMEE 5410]|uniref:hypothetical protein n=1 Tax=Acaryochloris sp. CCMEE 5410 TaxID=310037 RepID=UPI0021D32F99|nr:hypothetical protein [Acaryochloris sp. CCMEE 5410]
MYVTNAPISQLPLPQAVLYYREEWLVERGFIASSGGGYPRCRSISKPKSNCRLMFLLTLALKAFTLVEFVVRRALQAAEESLAGLYDGNPKRATQRPSTENSLRRLTKSHSIYCQT